MSFQEVINFVGGEVGRMERASVQAILPILDAAQRELTNDLAQWLATVPGGDAKFTAQRYRQALAQIKHTMAEIRAMEPALYQALLGNSFSAGQLATAHLQHEIQRFSLMYEGEARPTSLNAALIIARGNKELIPQFRSSAHRYAGGVGADIRAQLAIGVVRGETMDQLVNRLVRLGGPKGPVATRGVAGELGSVVENISEGLFTRYRHWAERLARTEVINAYNEHANVGLRDLAEDDPEMEKRWDASLDSRLCKVCQGLHGQTVPIMDANGVDHPFPGGYLRPPAHPCCRCAVVAWHKDWAGPSPGVTMNPDGSAEADFQLPPERPAARPIPPRPVVDWEDWHTRTQGQMDYVRLVQQNPDLHDALFGRNAPTFLKDRDLSEMLKIANGGSPTAPLTLKEARHAWERHLRIEKALKADKKWMEKYDPVTKARIKAEKAEAKKAAAKLEREARARAKELERAAKLGQLDGLKAVEIAKKRPMETALPENCKIAAHVTPEKIAEFEKGMKELTGKSIPFAEICHGFNPGPDCTMEVVKVSKGWSGGNNPTLQFVIYDKKTGKQMSEGEITRDFHKQDGKVYVHHAYLRLQPEFQNNGAAKIINGNAMLRYEKWGVQNANVTAAWVGRHAWASFGFNFDDPDHILGGFERYLSHKKNITPERRKEILADAKQIIDKPWLFAQMKIPEGKFADEYNPTPHPGGFEVGKAFLLSRGNDMWDGTLPVGKGNAGYEHALSTLKVWERL